MPFQPGQSGNPQGRKPGTKTRRTIEVRQMAERLVKDAQYLASLRRRLKAGKAPHMEPILWFYAFGKPKEHIRLEGDVSLELSVAANELRKRLQVLMREHVPIAAPATGEERGGLLRLADGRGANGVARPTDGNGSGSPAL